MTARTRLYAVRDRKTGAGQLVRAPSAAAAVRIMADSIYSVDVASQDDCVSLAAHGVLDETASGLAPEERAMVAIAGEVRALDEPRPRAEPVTVPADQWAFPLGADERRGAA